MRNLAWGSWIYGLLAAGIGGGATSAAGAIAVISVDPVDFNFRTTMFWQVTAAMFAIGAVTNFISYLKTHPLPEPLPSAEKAKGAAAGE